MSSSPGVDETPTIRGKAAAMLGVIPMGPGNLVKSSSVLNSKSDSSISSAATPDLFSYNFLVEFKGQSAQIEVGTRAMVSELYDKVLAGLGDKVRKDALERVLFYEDTAIYLPNLRRVDSFLLNPDIGDIIELSLKKKDKKAIPMVVICDGKTETVEINPNTTVQGVIQLLPRRTPDDEFMTLYNKKGKLEWQSKVASLLKKDEALEAKLDPELKAAGGAAKDKKKNRKSMTPMKKPLSGSSSSSSLATTPAPSAPGTPQPTKDKKNLERLLSNRPSEADLKKKNIIVDFKSDVKTAAPAAVDANAALPLQLRLFAELGTFIKKHLELVGLFRVSGDVEEVKFFYQSMWGKINWPATARDPHIATSALKLYLRKQVDPLIPFANYQEFMTAQKIEDEHAQLAALKAAIAKLPETNATILHYLLHLLTLVAEHEPQNKMNPINIGIVFGPTIMWDPKPNVMDFSSTGYQSSLVTTMIDRYKELWTTPPPDGGVSANNTDADSPLPAAHAALSPSEQNGSDRALPVRSPSQNLLRPTPPPAGTPPPALPPGAPPKRVPPKVPMGGPPVSSSPSPSAPTASYVPPATSSPQPAVSTSDLLQTRASFRKSLPPGTIVASGSPAPANGSSPPGSLFLSSVPESDVSAPSSSATQQRPSPPASRVISRRTSSLGSRYDTQISLVQEELRECVMLGTCPTATALTSNMDELRTHLASISHTELVRQMANLLAAVGGRPSTSS